MGSSSIVSPGGSHAADFLTGAITRLRMSPICQFSLTQAGSFQRLAHGQSMGQADVKGSIEPGKYADMTVLSDDIFTMPKENLRDVKVLKTIVGGKVVYEAK